MEGLICTHFNMGSTFIFDYLTPSDSEDINAKRFYNAADGRLLLQTRVQHTEICNSYEVFFVFSKVLGSMRRRSPLKSKSIHTQGIYRERKIEVLS